MDFFVCQNTTCFQISGSRGSTDGGQKTEKMVKSQRKIVQSPVGDSELRDF